VTAVVVSHNSARHLPALGHALLSGSLVPDRMLLIDNASVDDSVSSARLAGFDVHETGSNDGFGAACNAALSITSTEFVLFCNPDVLPSPGALEVLVTALITNSKAAIAGSVGARRFSQLSSEIVGFFPRRLQHRVQRFGGSLSVDQGKDQVVVDYVVGAFILCRVAALRSVGGFDERFFLYFEEDDLARRLGKSGWLSILVPAASVAHEDTASSEGASRRMMTPFRRHSAYLYYRKYHSRIYAEFARCTLAVGVTLDRIYRALVRRPQVYGPGTVTAPFRSIDALRRAHERRTARRWT
jgi:N-acetylglucosaminyl-diphospho-decaprenol L-rhamnosyltransferase